MHTLTNMEPHIRIRQHINTRVTCAPHTEDLLARGQPRASASLAEISSPASSQAGARSGAFFQWRPQDQFEGGGGHQQQNHGATRE